MRSKVSVKKFTVESVQLTVMVRRFAARYLKIAAVGGVPKLSTINCTLSTFFMGAFCILKNKNRQNIQIFNRKKRFFAENDDFSARINKIACKPPRLML
ncbi:MAG: hypothetical protein NC299_10825 [Lachnospiraceae bacterium]|nr:hypothetical protein [Lachnospiraceae bacterium]